METLFPKSDQFFDGPFQNLKKSSFHRNLNKGYFSKFITTMSTIVTAFLTKINQIDYRNVETYLEYGKKLLRINVPCVCFVEREIYETHFLSSLATYPQTYFFLFEKTDNYLYQYIDQVSQYDLHSDNPNKDTIDYMFLQCHKTEFLKQVASIDPFHTSNFTWIDFGIYHMIQNEDTLVQGITHVSQSVYPNVRIASCVDPNQPCVTDIYRFVVWYFAGSIIGGHKDSLISYANAMRDKCIAIIQEKHHIMWEINIWYLLYQDPQFQHLFNCYVANHDPSILLHY